MRQRQRSFRRRLAVGVMLLVALSGCGPSVECISFGGGDECQRVAEAALRAIPSGASRLTVGAGVGTRTPPYPVVACYPDDTSLAVEVTLTGDGAEVSPWTGAELPTACGR